jgi:predicted dienelactone hydrolase
MQHIFNHTTLNDPTEPGTFMLVTVYYPTRQIPNTTSLYLDSISAGIFESTIGLTRGVLSKLTTRLQFQAPTLLDTHPLFKNATSPYPSLVFTPGAGLPASSYTAYLSELASYGYAVIAIDHAGEAPYLPLPTDNDTHGIYGYPDFTNFPPTLDDYFAVLDYRVSDVLAAMSDAFFPTMVRQYGLPFNTTHFGVFGHSLGGAAAAAIMASKGDHVEMYKVGVNLDGTFIQVANSSGDVDTSVPAPDLKLPFLEVASEVHFQGNASAPGDDTWKYFNDAQSGWLRDVQLNGSTHLDFSDIPLWIDLLDQRAVLNKTWVGSVDAARVTHLVNALLKEFFGSMQGKGLHGVDEWVSQTPELFLLTGNQA